MEMLDMTDHGLWTLEIIIIIIIIVVCLSLGSSNAEISPWQFDLRFLIVLLLMNNLYLSLAGKKRFWNDQ